MNLYYAHLRLWVVAKENLRIGELLALVRILWTTIYLSAILCAYCEVIGYVDAVVHQFGLEVLVEQLEVDTFLQRLVGSRIENGVDHLVEQSFLVDVAVLNNLLKRL